MNYKFQNPLLHQLELDLVELASDCYRLAELVSTDALIAGEAEIFSAKFHRLVHELTKVARTRESNLYEKNR